MQLELFTAPTPLLDLIETAEKRRDRTPKTAGPKRATLRRRRKQFESYLRESGWPFVAVDEAKRAIFSGPSIQHFDYLVYSTNGANLLVTILADGRSSTPRQRAELAEWEDTFGSDFAGCLVRFQDGWVGITLGQYKEIGWHPEPLDLLI